MQLIFKCVFAIRSYFYDCFIDSKVFDTFAKQETTSIQMYQTTVVKMKSSFKKKKKNSS